MLYFSSTLNVIHSYYMQIFCCNDNKLLACNKLIINTLPNDIGHYVNNATDCCIYYGLQASLGSTCFRQKKSNVVQYFVRNSIVYHNRTIASY